MRGSPTGRQRSAESSPELTIRVDLSRRIGHRHRFRVQVIYRRSELITVVPEAGDIHVVVVGLVGVVEVRVGSNFAV